MFAVGVILFFLIRYLIFWAKTSIIIGIVTVLTIFCSLVDLCNIWLLGCMENLD